MEIVGDDLYCTNVKRVQMGCLDVSGAAAVHCVLCYALEAGICCGYLSSAICEKALALADHDLVEGELNRHGFRRIVPSWP